MIALLMSVQAASAQEQEISLEKIIKDFTVSSNIKTATITIETATAVFSENGFAIPANPEEKIEFSFVPKESFIPKRASYYVMNVSAAINSDKYFIVSREKGGQTFFGGLLKISPRPKFSCIIYNPGEDITPGGKIHYSSPYIVIEHGGGISPSIFNTKIGMFLPRHDIKPTTPPSSAPTPSELDTLIRVAP